MSAIPAGTRAVVMAGGRGSRMRAAGVEPMKPLVEVLGVPLVERNVCALVGAGATEIVIVTPREPADVSRFAWTRCVTIARCAGARLSIFEESQPLGTIGAVGAVGRGAEAVLVVNADNLTTLDLGALVRAHGRAGADLTVATHIHTDRLPFAEVAIDEDRVVGYVEKPERRARVSSAIYALGWRAIAMLAPVARRDAPWLVQALLASDARVRGFAHEAPWMDVNDGRAREEAEALVARHAEGFERWATGAFVEVAGCVLLRDGGVLLERRPPGASSYADCWDTPGGHVEPGETPAAAMAREAREELGIHLDNAHPIVVFDDADETSMRVFRHHVFAAPAKGTVTAREGQRLSWFPLDEVPRMPEVSRPARRAVLHLARSRKAGAA